MNTKTKTNTKTIRAGQLKAGDTFAFHNGQVFTVRGVLPVLVTDRGYFAGEGVTITTTHMGWEYTVDAHLEVELTTNKQNTEK